MAHRRLLLLSNSRNYGGGYLEHAEETLKEFLGPVPEVLFVPFAGVTVSFDVYAGLVRQRFGELGYSLRSVHEVKDAAQAIRHAEAIAVGGGNTFHLLERLYSTGLLEALRARALEGVPYMGWSAGSNLACPSIKTTNDMPIVEPAGFAALDLVPFQINPHYTEAQLPNHGGETRADRIKEFIRANPGIYVVGLPEGCVLRVNGDEIELFGEKPAKIFVHGREPFEVAPGESLQFLLELRRP
jgi:dipeptidase E